MWSASTGPSDARGHAAGPSDARGHAAGPSDTRDHVGLNPTSSITTVFGTTPSGTGGPTATGPAVRPAAYVTVLPDGRAAVAVATAMAQSGLPYVWGGNGPTAGHAGFDCSGLTTFSYRVAGIACPGRRTPSSTPDRRWPPVLRCSLEAWSSTAPRSGCTTSVCTSGTPRMVHASTFGQPPVRTAYYRWAGDTYLGASRPASGGAPATGPVAPLPVPSAPPAPPVLSAPPAPLPAALPLPEEPQPDEAATAPAARRGGRRGNRYAAFRAGGTG